MKDIIAAIDKQIRDLTKKRRELVEEQRKGREQELLDLKWLDEIKDFIFQENIGAYGSSEWCLVFNTKSGLLAEVLGVDHVPVIGKIDPMYSKCVILSRADYGYKLWTTSENLICDLIARLKGKISISPATTARIKVYNALSDHQCK